MRRSPEASTKRRSTGASGEPVGRDGLLYQFLRQSHIYAAAVREVLEVRLLEEVHPQPLSLSQFHLLKLICLNGHHHVGELADFLGVSPPATTKIIDKLESQGLVQRSSSKEDRRAILLQASSAGRALVDRYEQRKAERLAPILAGFDPADLKLLAGLLERMAMKLFALKDVAGGMCLRCAAYGDDACPIAPRHGNCPYQRIRGRHGAARGAATRPLAEPHPTTEV